VKITVCNGSGFDPSKKLEQEETEETEDQEILLCFLLFIEFDKQWTDSIRQSLVCLLLLVLAGCLGAGALVICMAHDHGSLTSACRLPLGMAAIGGWSYRQLGVCGLVWSAGDACFIMALL